MKTRALPAPFCALKERYAPPAAASSTPAANRACPPCCAGPRFAMLLGWETILEAPGAQFYALSDERRHFLRLFAPCQRVAHTCVCLVSVRCPVSGPRGVYLATAMYLNLNERTNFE